MEMLGGGGGGIRGPFAKDELMKHLRRALGEALGPSTLNTEGPQQPEDFHPTRISLWPLL